MVAALYTCGYEKLGMDLPSSYAADEFTPATEASIKRKLEIPSGTNFTLNIAFDCTDLGDPAHDKTLRNHFGGNALIMQHALKDARARKRVAEKLKSLKRHIKHWASVSKHQAAPRLNVAMMCRSGRHRSVCMAFFLEWCLTDSGFNVFPIVHVNKGTWGNLCSSCPPCLSSFRLKDDLRSDVLSLWRSL